MTTSKVRIKRKFGKDITPKEDKIKELEYTIHAWKEALLDPELSTLDKKDLNAIVRMYEQQLERVKRDTG